MGKLGRRLIRRLPLRSRKLTVVSLKLPFIPQTQILPAPESPYASSMEDAEILSVERVKVNGPINFADSYSQADYELALSTFNDVVRHFNIPNQYLIEPAIDYIEFLRSTIKEHHKSQNKLFKFGKLRKTLSLKSLRKDHSNIHISKNMDFLASVFIISCEMGHLIEKLSSEIIKSGMTIPKEKTKQYFDVFKDRLMCLNNNPGIFFEVSKPLTNFARHCLETRNYVFSNFPATRSSLVEFWTTSLREYSTLQSKKDWAAPAVEYSFADDMELRRFIQKSPEKTLAPATDSELDTTIDKTESFVQIMPQVQENVQQISRFDIEQSMVENSIVVKQEQEQYEKIKPVEPVEVIESIDLVEQHEQQELVEQDTMPELHEEPDRIDASEDHTVLDASVELPALYERSIDQSMDEYSFQTSESAPVSESDISPSIDRSHHVDTDNTTEGSLMDYDDSTNKQETSMHFDLTSTPAPKSHEAADRAENLTFPDKVDKFEKMGGGVSRAILNWDRPEYDESREEEDALLSETVRLQKMKLSEPDIEKDQILHNTLKELNVKRKSSDSDFRESKNLSVRQRFGLFLDSRFKELSGTAEFKYQIITPWKLYERFSGTDGATWDELPSREKDAYYFAFKRHYSELLEHGDRYDSRLAKTVADICAEIGE
ncbi:hypothetical protein OGAPHI_004861 [Ogataea philodendri]|uniref:Uncharacterized protein n=1 Tax=Ogataea philodendri TaxID=1378263 RepID=A0A9P8P2R4_9ASCO|nr:uncharacterized protein OGAPHI_004861 [Ogataea philodendri]KAH3664147.1 hypothetical protein OGAPHI_004861 [Ogataea philodendri]